MGRTFTFYWRWIVRIFQEFSNKLNYINSGKGLFIIEKMVPLSAEYYKPIPVGYLITTAGGIIIGNT